MFDGTCFCVFIAQIAEADGTPVFKFKRWRIKGQIIPEVFEQYKAVRHSLISCQTKSLFQRNGYCKGILNEARLKKTVKQGIMKPRLLKREITLAGKVVFRYAEILKKCRVKKCGFHLVWLDGYTCHMYIGILYVDAQVATHAHVYYWCLVG